MPILLHDADTIAAIASGAGRAGIGVIRISGPLAPQLARQICGHELPARQASYLPFLDADGSVLDRGIALLFEAPHSFTVSMCWNCRAWRLGGHGHDLQRPCHWVPAWHVQVSSPNVPF